MGQSKHTATLTERLLKKKSKDKGGGSRKYGRNLGKCKQYRAVRYRTNKLRGLKTHLTEHPADNCAVRALNRLQQTV